MPADPFDPNVVFADIDAPQRIYLDGETFCLVDAADYDWLTRWKWNWEWHGKLRKRKYASRRERRDGRNLRIFMHREILQAPPHLFGDHGDGDGLNNQRHNLKLATPKENAHNRRPAQGRPH